MYHSTAIFVLRPHHLPRKLAILMLESRLFEPIIALTILFNCILMAWDSPVDPPHTWKADFVQVRSLLVFRQNFPHSVHFLS